MLPELVNKRPDSDKFCSRTIRLGRDELMPHIVSIVLSEGYISTGEIRRRLFTWGYRFSRMTLWRAVRKLEIYGLVEVDRMRGPRGNFLKPSKRLVQLRFRGHGSHFGGNILRVLRYVENSRRRWEFGFEFSGVGLDHVRWLQVYGRRGGGGGKWFRFEFHPFRGEEADYVRALRDLLRVAAAVSFVLGLSWPDVVRVFAEEYARFL